MINLLHGDCYELIKNLPDKSIDVCITDPPYLFKEFGGGIMRKRDYTNQLADLNCCNFNPSVFLDAIHSKLKKTYIYAFCNKSLVSEYISWAQKHKCNYDILVMCKSNPIPAYNNHYLSDLEYIIVIREPGTYFCKEKDIELYRKWFMTSCKKGLHPAEKPVTLLEKFIKVSCPDNGTVLDPFMGSGSTGVACVRTKRNFIGIEIDEKYFKLAKERINEAKNENILFDMAV